MTDEFLLADPWYLLLLALPLAVLLIRTPRGGIDFGAFPLALRVLRPSHGPFWHRLAWVLGLTCLVVALARPGYGRRQLIRHDDGRDLILVVDLSLSMITDDMFDAEGRRIDRLRAVFAAADDFIDQRPHDRIGLVFFAITALVSCPPTTDHETVKDFLAKIERQQRALWSRTSNFYHKTGLLDNGTNLGLGIGIALRGLARTDSPGKAIILVTDGRDTRTLDNWVDPLVAAQQAKTLATRVHCIGVGDRNGTMTDFDYRLSAGTTRFRRLHPDFLPDMARLEEIARIAGGIALPAADRDGLRTVFERINELEPTPREERYVVFATDRFHVLLLIAGVLLLGATTFDPLLRGRP